MENKNRFEKVIRGQIVLEDQIILGEIGINNEKIISITSDRGTLVSDVVLDVGDNYIFPGFIDVHVHCFSNPDEGFEKVSKSAAVGGITSFLDMPYDLPHPINTVENFNQKKERLAKECVVDVGLIATIKKEGGIDQIIPLAEAGATSYKMSLFETDAYRFPRIPDYEILDAFELIKQTGLRVGFHAENDDIINHTIEKFRVEGKINALSHAKSRPPVSETSAILKLLDFAYWTDVKLHIFHVSHPRSLEFIKQFRQEGVDVTSETCYHYLLMDENALPEHGPLAKMNPPLRTEADVEKLWKHLKNDEIDFITSDHAPWDLVSKLKGKENIFDSPSGLPGIETLIPLMFDAAVATGKITPVHFAKLLATNPARLFGMKNKGEIKIGYDADFTIIDPNAFSEVDASSFQSLAKWSPFDGQTLRGKIQRTIVRGEVVYDGRSIVQEAGFGKFIPGSAAKERTIING